MTSSQPSSQPVAGQSAPSTGSMFTQISSVLAVIIILILAGAWLAKRFGFAARHNSSQSMNVSASCQLGQRERVVVVEVEDARLVLGVTAQQITHLHTLPPKAADEHPQAPATATTADFRQVLQSLLKGAGKQK